MLVTWRLTKARHAAIPLEVVELSEQLRSVISAWLGAVRRSVQVRLCTSGCKSEKMFGIISPPRDMLPSIVLIKSRPSLAVFFLSSLRLSYRLPGRYGRRLQLSSHIIVYRRVGC